MDYLSIIIIAIFVLSLILLNRLQKYEVEYVKSNIDNKKYLVRDLLDKQDAADLLALVKLNIDRLTNHLYMYRESKYKNYVQYIEQLNNNIKNVIINESSEDNMYTSYSINKGEQIVFCIRSRYDGSLHDLNLIMYVAIHEIAHVACPEYGHTTLFKKIFAFLLLVAIELDIYKRIDFKNEPAEYCGLTISDSII